jgi:hypothetical protein
MDNKPNLNFNLNPNPISNWAMAIVSNKVDVPMARLCSILL